MQEAWPGKCLRSLSQISPDYPLLPSHRHSLHTLSEGIPGACAQFHVRTFFAISMHPDSRINLVGYW
jgi:hypothetical protein